jgi:hypothetical protein
VFYETIARLGRGGMGVVDLARDAQGNRVALKRITLTGSASDILRGRQRLLREAEVLRRLHHPNVVRLVDVLDEGDEIVLVMPYLNGGSLAERVAQHGPAPADEVERQARRLFGALAQAHAAGIVHRDIKPANILFDDRGEPLLADFGVAQTPDHTQGLTVTGMVVGTPGFMAPEQARGEQITPASDVFSLGATLLFAATAQGPFGVGDPALLMVRAASSRVEKVPRSLPASLRRLLKETLRARPERRPTAAALVSPQGFLSALPSGRRPQPPASWAVVGGAAAGVVLVAGAFLVIDREGGDEVGSDALVPPSCDDRRYQPCGQAEPAAGTDGVRCLEGFTDLDGEPANGCESAAGTGSGAGDTAPGSSALPDSGAGELLLPDDEAQGAITPDEENDAFDVRPPATTAPGMCDGPVTLTLTVPDAADMVLEVRIGDLLLTDAASLGGEPAVATLPDPCGLASPSAANLYATGFQATVDTAAEVAEDHAYTLRVESG